MSARQKEILGSLVLAGLICAVGFGDDIQRQDESVQINPALKVIKRLYVAVEPGQVDLNELSGWDVLKKKIENTSSFIRYHYRLSRKFYQILIQRMKILQK